MLHLIANGLVLTGATLLILAIRPLQQLITQLPRGPLRRRWHVLRLLIISFIVGYFGYIFINWNELEKLQDLVVPAVFFLGGWFALLVSRFSLQTAVDVRRLVLLEQENITDPLMGIYNRRYLERRLEDEEQMAHRYNLPLSVLMIDIDHFKSINDTYGHQVGDAILIGLGKLVVQTVRATDFVARYGGEELIVIAPNTATETAITLAERLRAFVEQSALAKDCKQEGGKSVKVTVSIGVSRLDLGNDNAHALIQRADAALYRAKVEGRNRVVVSG
jgi:diguanylate cyclase (GGDEF)-like protein